MQEQRISITISEDGRLNVKTDGIKGEACISEVEELLDGIADIEKVDKTDEYYQKINTVSQNKNIQK